MLPEYNYHRWKLLREEPLSNLEQYKNHHRLRVFYHKGTTCAICGKQHGTVLGVYEAKNGAIHIDVYTAEGVMINVDHIKPKSKGGSNDLSNLQPSCYPCNHKKGNGEKHNTCTRAAKHFDLSKTYMYRANSERRLVTIHHKRKGCGQRYCVIDEKGNKFGCSGKDLTLYTN